MAVLRLDRLSPAGQTLVRAVAAAAARREAWLVGGAVRDAFLRRAPGADVDVVLPSGALEVGRRVAYYARPEGARTDALVLSRDLSQRLP